MESENVTVGRRVPWNKGKLTGQKPPPKFREIWAIRTRRSPATFKATESQAGWKDGIEAAPRRLNQR